MSNISKRRREGSRAKIKSMGDHKEFLKRITKTLYYGQLPSLPCLSLPVTEISCEVWSEWQRGRSVKRLHADSAAHISRSACVSPAALVLALLYMERLRSRSPDYLSATAPADLFLITLMVGNKFLQDDGEDEEVICAEWATSGGLELRQLKRLELQFLTAIDWNVFVNEKSFEKGLQWLERRVALKQAHLRGFFTYGDLLAAGAGAGATAGDGALLAALRDAAEASVAAAVSYLAGLLALVTSALVVSAACLPAHHLLAALSARGAVSLALADTTPPPPPRPPMTTLAQYIPNSTDLSAELPFETSTSSPLPACCDGWTRYREQSASAEKRQWFGGGGGGGAVEFDWGSLWAWRARTSVLNWLYQSSLVDPLQRWLERLDEYAEGGAGAGAEGGAGAGAGAGARQWLNLSKLGALMASVSDR